jgi:uncharacterized protein (DUF362 family)
MNVMPCASQLSGPDAIARREFVRRLGGALAGAAFLGGGQGAAGAQSRVVLVKSADRVAAIRSAVKLLGQTEVGGKTIYLKGNYTAAYDFPATTHPDSLRTVVALLREQGCGEIVLVERSWLEPSAEVWRKLGTEALARELNIRLLPLESLTPDQWRKIDMSGSHWKNGFEVPRFINAEACVIQICNPRTHRFGGFFSASLKNSVGLVAKYTHETPARNSMLELHESPAQRLMIAEVNVAYVPALVILDAMQVFVSEGPERGETASPGVIVAARDRVAIDATAAALLRTNGAGLPLSRGNIFQLEQLKGAVGLKLGAESADQIEYVTDKTRDSEFVVSQIKTVLSETEDEKKPG